MDKQKDLVKKNARAARHPITITDSGGKTKSAAHGQLKVASVNCCRWTTSRKQTLEGLEKHSIDVLCLQETFAQHKITLEGWTTYQQNRTVARGTGQAIGGGVAILVREGLTVKKTEALKGKVTEMITVTLSQQEAGDLTIANVYRPPTGGKDDKREDDFSTDLLPYGEDAVIVGDFNLHHASWDAKGKAEHGGRQLHRWMTEHQMAPWNDPNQSTRVGGSATSPDIAICPADWPRSWRILENWNSDHSPMLLVIPFNAKPLKQKKKYAWRWNKPKTPHFTKAMDTRAKKVLRCSDYGVALCRLTAAIMGEAKQHIGKSQVVNAKRDSWWTPEVQEALDRRNSCILKLQAQKQVTPAESEELQKLKEAAKHLVNMNKEQAWAKLTAKLSTEGTGQVFNRIRTMDGRSVKKQTCPLVEEEEAVFDAQDKAKILGEHFAAVSKTEKPRVDERGKHKPLQRTERNNKPHPSETRFSMQELNAAMLKLKTRKCPGPDGVHNEMLLQLGGEARKALLHVINLSWEEELVDEKWRRAVTKPLSKPGRDPSWKGNYRPIDLTSNICKLMEKMVRQRVTCLLEDPDSGVEGLDDAQAGFRTGRNATEQVALLSQCMKDARAEDKVAIPIFLDFAKAFDTVKKEKLIEQLNKKNLPPKIVNWIASFLEERMAAVTVDDELGPYVEKEEGVPQGTVLSPLLFLCYVDDIARELAKQGIIVSLYADDMAVVAIGKTTEEARKQAQKALAAIEKWTADWGIKLSQEKTCCMCVARKKQAPPTLTFADGGKVPYDPTPRFLGVLFDEWVHFKEHAQEVEDRLQMRTRVLQALAGKEWGCRAATLRTVYVTYVLPVATYAMGVYWPALPAGKKDKLKVLHNNAARIITGCRSSTYVPDLLHLARLWPLEHTAEHEVTKLYERYNRMEGTSGWQALKCKAPKESSKKTSWLREARARNEELKLDEHGRAPVHRVSAIPPWEWYRLEALDLRDEGQGIKKLSKEAQHAKALEMISRLPTADTTIYTDGSVNKQMGGAGVYIERAGGHTHLNAGVCMYADSFLAELTALEMALQHLLDTKTAGEHINILTDSMAGVMKLKQGPARQSEDIVVSIWQKVYKVLVSKNTLTVCYIPGHCGLNGNEEADEEARKGADKSATKALSLTTALNHSKKRVRDKHAAARKEKAATLDKVLGGKKPPKRTDVSTRPQETYLHQLMTGHHTILRDLDNRNVQRKCHKCQSASRTLEHILLECPKTAAERTAHIDTRSLHHATMADPMATLTFLKATGDAEDLQIDDKAEKNNKKRDIVTCL